MVVKCKNCGSTDVEVQTWVNPNTQECSALSDLANIICDEDDCWCKECEENAELIIEESEIKYYTCPVCEEQKLRYAVIDLDGTNLEEGYCCESCGETFIGLYHDQVVELNPNINE